MHCVWPQIKKVDDLRGDISRLELSLGSAKAEYDKLKAANLSETARFAMERRAEYIEMLENFTATQVIGWRLTTCMQLHCWLLCHGQCAGFACWLTVVHPLRLT